MADSHTSRMPSQRRMVSLTPLAAAAAAVVLVVAGIGIGLFLTRSYAADTRAELAAGSAELAALDRAHTQLQERNQVLFSRIEALEGQLEATRSARADDGEGSSADGTGDGAYGDGTYRVGEEIPAGTYRGTVTGETGYWARLKSTTGTLGSIAANGVPRGDFVLTIYPSDAAVELRGVVLTGPE